MIHVKTFPLSYLIVYKYYAFGWWGSWLNSLCHSVSCSNQVNFDNKLVDKGSTSASHVQIFLILIIIDAKIYNVQLTHIKLLTFLEAEHAHLCISRPLNVLNVWCSTSFVYNRIFFHVISLNFLPFLDNIIICTCICFYVYKRWSKFPSFLLHFAWGTVCVPVFEAIIWMVNCTLSSPVH